MKYFTIEEMCKSATAKNKGIANVPNDEQVDNMVALIDNILDPVREAYRKPIIVNSGFRSVELNKAVGGVARSQHLAGEAADITVGSKTKNRVLFNVIRSINVPFDQMILEYGGAWIHISYKKNGNNRKQVLFR